MHKHMYNEQCVAFCCFNFLTSLPTDDKDKELAFISFGIIGKLLQKNRQKFRSCDTCMLIYS